MNELDLFTEALARTDPAERAAFLDRACAGDPELRRRLEELLAGHARSQSPLDRPPLEPGELSGVVEPATAPATGVRRPDEGAETLVHADRPDAVPSTDVTGDFRPDGAATVDPADSEANTPVASEAPAPRVTRVATGEGVGTAIAGRYRLVDVIGEGGMGSVYLAEQTEPVRRQVALKLIRTGMDSRGVLARFDAERQALALMDHPNIARIYDGGVTPAGQPFFVMELVRGVPLTEYCDRKRLSVDERLELFVAVCQAVQHAHQKGIIHRDLKPGNVLVTEVDGRATPKVIDFGVAKATEQDLTDMSFADTGAIVGTPTYMSPEQADPSSMDIDTRTDVYALGVMLYELLVGSTPLEARDFRRGAILEMLRMVREVDPPRPSTRLSGADALPSIAANRSIEPARLSRLMRGELDWIVMKALEKDRTRRYDTANGLARDIQRYLSDEVVEARPPSRGYRLRKFAKRNKGQVIAASLVFLALVGGIVGTSIGLYQANRARDAEATQRAIAVQEKTKAEASATLAKEQRGRAEDHESQAIAAVKRFGDVVSTNKALKDNPALEPLRKELLNEPLRFFKTLRVRLQADRDTRPESLRRLASAALDLAMLTNEIGDRQGALVALRESLVIGQELADANPSVTEFQSELAAGHNNIGNLLADTGKPAEAMAAYESALAIRQKLADANPSVTQFQSQLALSHNNIGVLLSTIGKPAEALKAHESALAIRRRLVDANPSDTRLQNELAMSYNNIGGLLHATGRPAEGLTAHESALAIRQKLVDANPSVIQFQSDLALSHSNRGVVLSGIRKPAEAMAAFKSALAIRQKLADANPSVTQFQSDVALSYNNIGGVLYSTGRPAEAMKVFQSALEIGQRLADSNPTVTKFQVDLADSHNTIGGVLRATGQPAEARMKAYESALAIRQKLATDHPESPDFASSLGGTLNNLATIDLDAARFEKARARLREAITWQRKALASNPAHPTYRRFLANHLTNLIVAARGLGDSAGVAEAERELAELRDSDPATMELDARLAAVVKSDQAPKDNAERLRLAQFAYDRGLHAAAAKLWADALDADPQLGNDRQAQRRYNAACAAVLAAGPVPTGRPESVRLGPALQDAEKAKLRSQALDWLKAELSAWKKASFTIEPGNKELIARTLTHWRADADLASIRDSRALAKLPEGEQTEWLSLWADVDALLKQTQGAKP